MKRARFAFGALALLASIAVVTAQSGRSYGGNQVWWNAGDGGILPWEEDYDDPTGQLTILNTTGFIHTKNHAFFEPLGVNGRACVTCHQPSNAMSLSAAAARTRWAASHGKDPLFAAVDGSNCPDLPQQSASSHSLLLDRGLIRISLPWPPANVQPEFRLEVLRDPTGCNHSPGAISVYRRPRVAANLKHVIAGPAGMSFMADSREPSLRAQAINAALLHEQAQAPPNPAELRQIIDFETQIYVAQSADIRGGLLDEKAGPGSLGPEKLSAAVSGLPAAMSFEVWKKPKPGEDGGVQREFRASVARGSDLFFSRRSGLVSCASCHQPGTTRWMDIGTTNFDGAPDLPLFRITCEASGRVVHTQDPGRALISGKCADVGAIVVPQLRGLAARAPYFSNGSAQTLRNVVEFYDKRFGLRYTEQEKQDLVNFLSAL
jgi:hypothetical protein